ncbi:MAG: hypothetical protein IPJ65_40005 [Archangiaceae bacterium]|nr:hypothetical protein [Archangiaceae bacterium]
MLVGAACGGPLDPTPPVTDSSAAAAAQDPHNRVVLAAAADRQIAQVNAGIATFARPSVAVLEPGITPPPEPTPTEPPVAEPPPATDPAPTAPPPATDPAPTAPPPAMDPPPAPTPTPDPNAGWLVVPQGTSTYSFPQGQTGPGTTGAAFVWTIAGASKYRIRYEVMPEGNFDFRAGGKLPGLAGGSAPAGGSDAIDGWSGRLMWNAGGQLSFYFYNVSGGVSPTVTDYGTHWLWASDAKLVAGQWNTVEILYDLSTGETRGYLNGVEKAHQTLTYHWGTADRVMMSAFFGGQGVQYQPSKLEHMSFRNMMIKSGG